MDKLFSRKRSASIAARHKDQYERAKAKDKDAGEKPGATLKKSATTGGNRGEPLSEKRAGKRKEAVDAAFGIGGDGSTRRPARVGDKAPSLDVDIRTSLIMPGLSQRFSVLLPKLSSAPETSLRSLLASQRERSEGPSLTLEEEEMLFAEMRATHGAAGSSGQRLTDDWDGQPPSSSAEAWKNHSQGYLARSNISASASSPSILSMSSDSTVTAKDRHGQSPPPTSSSFSSFQTFGASSSSSKPQPRSYGFSGGSGMRDDTYLRKVASSKNLNGSVSSRKSGKPNEAVSPRDEPGSLPPTSQGRTKDLAGEREITFQQLRSESGSTSSIKAFPTTAAPGLEFPPLPDTPVGPVTPGGSWSKRAKRQSHMAGLSSSQQKRISRALLEIDHELRRDGLATQITKPAIQEEEEVLEPESEESQDIHDTDAEAAAVPHHQRRPSYPESDASFQSQHSAPFPYGVSPAKSEKAVIEPPSPTARLPPSPKMLDLKAQVEGAAPMPGSGTQEEIPPLNLARKLTARMPQQQTPTPILTPSRTHPIKHTPSPSMSPSAVSPVPGYIPGQPRPVGSLHRSEGSVSSRSATPTNHTPTTTAPTSAQSSASLKGHMRAGSTPTHQHPPIASRSSSLGRSRSVNQGPDSRHDNDESPSKGSSSNGQNLANSRLLLDRDAPTSRRPSSLLSVQSPPIIEEEGEDAHGLSDHDSDSIHRQPTPDIRVIPQRKEMTQAPHDHQQYIQEARDALGWSLKSGKGDTSRVVSEEGFIGGSTESGAVPSSALMHDAHMRALSPEDWKRTLREAPSRQSLSSDYAADEPSEAVWDDLFESPRNTSSEAELLQTPVSADAALSDTLRKLSGIGKEELADLQDKLVSKAKAERQAIRDESPTVRDTPVMQPAGSLPKRSASLARGPSPLPPAHLSPELPPSAWRRPSGERATPSPGPSGQPAPPKSLAGLFTPQSTATPPATAIPSEPSRTAPAVLAEPVQPPLQTPSAEGHDEIVYTPQSDPLSRKTSSAAAVMREVGKVPLEEDPEVRRDFEARIAAATAALNRTPSLGGSKLERKPTKKGAAIVISSPKLVSSSANVAGTPLTPPESSIDPAMRKALDKTSGTAGGKSSGRWRKLGFRRGPSLSSQATAEPINSPPPPTPPTAGITPTLGATPTTEKKLEEAINLPAGATISPDLDNFKFPPLANRPPKNPALRDRPISPPMPYQPAMQQVVQPQPQPPSALMRSESDARSNSTSAAGAATIPPPPVVVPASTPPTAIPASARSGTHSHSSSSDSAVAQFLASGRALGLNQEQLDQMLVANGMLDRSATTASSRSYQSTAPTTTSFSQSGHSHTRSDSQSKQGTHKTTVTSKPADKPKGGGLFRSFSKSRKTKTTPQATSSPDPNVTKAEELTPTQRNVVVRRTILVPRDEVKVPTTPTMVKTPSTVAESPDMSRQGTGPGRKQSIKRKPLNLTQEDHELVSSSPPSHRRNFSTGTTYSNRSDGQPDSAGPVNKGLGFLHPLGNSARSIGGTGSSLTGISESPSGRRRSSDSRRRSSTGGSLYDLYGDDSTGQDSQEFLKPDAIPDRRTSDQASGHSAASNPAVEICEYADGRVVWAVVDGLRDDDEVPIGDYSFSNHSRNDSFASNGSSTQNDRAGPWPGKAHNFNTPALNFRHRDRGHADVPRPETFVYKADTRDVADLIDHLSRDLDPSGEALRGRIDFSHLDPSFGVGPDDGSGTAQSSPFPYSTTQSRQGDIPSSPDPRFADPPSPEPTRPVQQSSPHRSPPPPIFAPPPTAHIPAGGFSPKRQMMLRQGFGAHRANMHLGGSVVKGSTSPSGVSFSSSNSGGGGGQRTVEERLQDLLDRLKRQNEQDANRTARARVER